MLNKESLLKFVTLTELAILKVEDESSENTDMYVLHLADKIGATSSIPAPNGQPMKVTDNKVFVGGENIEKFMADCTEKDGVLIYKGKMHLDVSKPSIRDVNGEPTVTKPARIWLTAVKFSRSGGQLRNQRQQTLNNVINGLFANGNGIDLTSEIKLPEATPPVVEEVKKVEPEVVANKGQKNGQGKEVTV